MQYFYVVTGRHAKKLVRKHVRDAPAIDRCSARCMDIPRGFIAHYCIVTSCEITFRIAKGITFIARQSVEVAQLLNL